MKTHVSSVDIKELCRCINPQPTVCLTKRNKMWNTVIWRYVLKVIVVNKNNRDYSVTIKKKYFSMHIFHSRKLSPLESHKWRWKSAYSRKNCDAVHMQKKKKKKTYTIAIETKEAEKVLVRLQVLLQYWLFDYKFSYYVGFRRFSYKLWFAYEVHDWCMCFSCSVIRGRNVQKALPANDLFY